MSKGSFMKTPLTTVAPSIILKRNVKGDVPHFWDWDEYVHDRAQLLFPEIHLELTTPPVAETEEAARIRRLDGIPQLPLEDERSKVLGEAAYNLIQTLPVVQRARATDLAVEEMQISRRADNVIISAINYDRRLTYEDLTKRDLAKLVERPKLSAWLLIEECITHEALAEIKADGLFVSTNAAHAHMEIIRRVLGGVSAGNRKMRKDLLDQLRALRQESKSTHVYSTMFKHCLRKCVSTGTVVPEADLVDLFVYGLNLSVFEQYIRAYTADPTGPDAPKSLSDAMSQALKYQVEVTTVNPALAKYLDNSTKGHVAFSTEEVDAAADRSLISEEQMSSRSTQSAPTSERAPCQLCGKTNHSASMCFRLTDVDFLKQVGEELEKKGYSRRKSKSSKTRSPAVDVIPAVNAVAVPPLSDCSLTPTDEVNVVFDPSALREANFEHDDHAQVSVLNEQTLWMFETMFDCDDEVVGVVPGVVVKVSKRGMLKFDLGRAVVIPGAPRLLASAPEIRRSYDMSSHGGVDIRYTHKTTKAVICFRLDQARFDDEYFHAVFEDVPANSVALLDFYNPPPLQPIRAEDEARVWPMIRSVERLHWATDHMSADDMTRLVSSSGYYGEVTAEAVTLFVVHRGCSACSMGTMRAHSQLESSRGLATVIGKVAQGDVFFVECDTAKIPVLLITCEASLFIYLHVFVDAAARARGGRVAINAVELESAFEGVISVWKGAGHPLETVRFDRESAITASSIGTWLISKNVDLLLTAAGQKLGLAEVTGRIVKNRCRSIVAGIKEKYGYTYPVRWFTRLVGDTVCVLNRTVRRGASLSPSQQFFGPSVLLDVRRDLRASIGEVLMFKTPKRGAATTISAMKAEWGIVISRAFNGSGVLETYFFESKSYGHRFKFERLVVPPFAMQLLRGLSLPPGSAVYGDVDHEEGLLPDLLPPSPGEDSVTAQPNEADRSSLYDIDSVAELSIDAPLLVLAAQISYRKALLVSPDRAVAAMEDEIRMLFGVKRLGRPVLIKDIPLADHKFILRNLDGYKEKFRAGSGEWLKSKARVFADGSKQLPEYTAESSSPVARMESIFALAGIAAYKGFEVIRFDVVCGYPNAERPAEVLYRYLKLNPQVTAILTKLFPAYAAFVDPKGSLIIDLDRMLYGMKEAGYFFYLLMMEMFHKARFATNPVDPCMMHLYHSDGWEAHNALMVDDCLVAVSSPEARDVVMAMFTERFGT